MPFTATVIDLAATRPERVAIAEGTETITYGELASRSPLVYAGVQSVLLHQKSPEDFTVPPDMQGLPVIAVSLESALHAAELVAILAGYGTITTVMDPLWPTEHRIRAVRTSGTRLVVTDDPEFARELEDWPGSVITYSDLIDRGTQALDESRPTPPQPRDDAEPFCLIFTSGTTDLPKGFLRTRHSWRVNMDVSRRYLKASPGVRTLAPGSLAYSLTLYALVETLGTGGSIWLQSRFDPIAAARIIDEESLERLVTVPAVLPALAAAARHRGSSLTSLRDVIVGGANLSAALRDEFETAVPTASVLSYYGAAEIGFIGQSLAGEGNVLEPFDGVELSVRDETGAEAESGELGQLFVRVASQGDRYLSTAPITGPDGWSTVNDMARLDGGVLVLEGRAGDIAVTGGHKVSLLQIERALDRIGYERSSVVTQPDDALGEILVAVIEGPETPSKTRLLQRLRDELPPQFVPRRFYLAEHLPRTVGGKVRRVQVREELEDGRYQRL